MTNQQKANIDFLEQTLRRKSKIMLYAFHINPSLFNLEMDEIISEVLHRQWGNEGYDLKYRLYKYLESTKRIVGNAIGNYVNTVKAINSPILKDKRRNISKTVKQLKRGN